MNSSEVIIYRRMVTLKSMFTWTTERLFGLLRLKWPHASVKGQKNNFGAYREYFSGRGITGADGKSYETNHYSLNAVCKLLIITTRTFCNGNTGE